MTSLYNIPQHTKCTNCGSCCGIIPATQEEVTKIKEYIKEHNIKPRKPSITCPFRNAEIKRCDIYPVRPIICKLMGVTNGMECPHGNSHEIDGSKFIVTGEPMILNFIDWESEEE